MMVLIWGIVALSLFMLLLEKLKGTNGFGDKPVDAIHMKKSKVCQLVLDWCHDNIRYDKTQKPQLEVVYYLNQKVSGVYYSSGHLCKIYVNNHRTLRELTNTVIHEYVHARQRDKDFDKLYSKYLQEVGYYKNPYEKEARKVASRHENECLNWLQKQIAA